MELYCSVLEVVGGQMSISVGPLMAAATESRLPSAARLNSARRVYVNTYRVANR